MIIEPFNGVFWLVAVFFLVILVAMTKALKNRDDRTKRIAISIASLVTLVWFVVYKYMLSKDMDYSIITEELGGFNWWGELPFHLCNVNMILVPIGVLLNKKSIMSMCFYVGPLGALMAILMPGLGFSGYELFLPRIISYYGTHFMIIVEGLLIVSLGLYQPRFKDIPKTILTAIAFCFGAFLISMTLRATGLHPDANYFYSVYPQGNPILEMFYNLIPVPFLYVMPCSIILGIYMFVVTLGLHLKHIIIPEDAKNRDGSSFT